MTWPFSAEATMLMIPMTATAIVTILNAIGNMRIKSDTQKMKFDTVGICQTQNIIKDNIDVVKDNVEIVKVQSDGRLTRIENELSQTRNELKLTLDELRNAEITRRNLAHETAQAALVASVTVVPAIVETLPSPSKIICP